MGRYMVLTPRRSLSERFQVLSSYTYACDREINSSQANLQRVGTAEFSNDRTAWSTWASA